MPTQTLSLRTTSYWTNSVADSSPVCIERSRYCGKPDIPARSRQLGRFWLNDAQFGGN